MRTCMTAKYCWESRRCPAQSDLKPISSMFGESLPSPARVRHDFAPSSKLQIHLLVRQKYYKRKYINTEEEKS